MKKSTQSHSKIQEEYDKTVNHLLNEYSFKGQFKDDSGGAYVPEPGSVEEGVYNTLRQKGAISVDAWDAFIDEKYGDDAADISYDESLDMIGELFGMQLDLIVDTIWWTEFEG